MTSKKTIAQKATGFVRAIKNKITGKKKPAPTKEEPKQPKPEARPVGKREVILMDNKRSGMIVTGSKEGDVIVPLVDVRDGKAFRERVNRIVKDANFNQGSKYFQDGDAKKFYRSQQLKKAK